MGSDSSTRADFSAWTGNGAFGRWGRDEYGLPCYDYSPPADGGRRAVTTEDSLVHSPWHQAGNSRVTATLHGDGHAELYASDRGLFRITPFEPRLGTPGGCVAALYFPGMEPVPLLRGFLSGNARMEARFGMGYARFASDVRGAHVELTHWVPHDDSPAVVTDVAVTPGPEAPETLIVAHGVAAWFIDFDPICSGWRRERFGDAPLLRLLSLYSRFALYPLRRNTNWRRLRFARSFRYLVESPGSGGMYITPVKHGNRQFDPKRPVPRQEYPQTFFSRAAFPGAELHAAEAVPSFTEKSLSTLRRKQFNAAAGEFRGPVNVGHSFILSPRGTQRFRVTWGYADHAEAVRLGRAYEDAPIETHMAARRERSFHFSVPGVPWAEREWAWHGEYLRGAAMYDRYYDSHTVRQGSAYYFIQGVDGAPRDHALFAAALSYLDPALAKEVLVTMLRATHPDGRLPYALYGYGMSSGFGLHSVSSDLYLFFLWALTEYVFATRDFAFLDETHEYYPAGCGLSRTVREAAVTACRYIIEKVGIGAHGLLRSGTGDWNDFIQFHAKNRRAYIRKGESAYNTAMALYALPRAADLVAMHNGAFAGVVRRYAALLREALLRQWNGRWLLRSRDGRGNPIGDDTLFLEHHAWALVSGALPPEMSGPVVHAIHAMLDAPSPCGANILAPPARLRFNLLPPGWDTNGGVWPAVNALLTWGYGRHDRDFARESLFKNTLAARAEAYPGVWYGAWTGPDGFNAHYAKNPGETFYHITPMADFPAMNANQHAAPLLAALKLCGVEPAVDGFHIAPALPDEEWSMRTNLLELSRDRRSLVFRHRYAAGDGAMSFTVEDALCASPGVTVASGEGGVPFERTGNRRIRFVLPHAGGELGWRIGVP